MLRRFASVLLAVGLAGCLAPPDLSDVAATESSLTAAQRRVRAGQIRDAAAANGITQGWLLAGIADAETSMSHCWSELTWACMGPNSPDCGGGPVVAGAADGPCSAMQGGLGMFQFDAGTFADTLAREGDRILTIAGNTAAAVDFVVAMVIRSSYVPGVDTRAQAIDWINGVRIGNDRWDPWVRTVTHYYNGCAPSYSCWSSRYAHYRDNTSGVYNEMGADFWESATDYAATWVSQSFPLAAEPFELYPGQEMTGSIVLHNAGAAAWMPGVTNLGTTQPRDGASPLVGPDWIGPNRPATVDRMVPPGEDGTFTFTIRAPDAPGDYPQFFTLVQEGVAWFSDQGGPPDDQLQVRVTVLEPPPCPAGTGAAWACDGADRVRCVAGEVERETCEFGCADAACQADPMVITPPPPTGPVDMDMDGYTDDVDCDDAEPTVNPGAEEICDDDFDQNCDGFECHVTEDGGVEEFRIGTPLTSGCATAPGRSGAPWLLALLGLPFVLRRRR
ncbi:MAG: hypothetical protein KC619_06360 [Myxococcales bacterium]|nr:hypothetical protein [Myxococcales bacterium]